MSIEGFRTFEIDKILETYGPKDSSFEVVLPDGETLIFRPHQRKSELDEFFKQASDWYNELKKPGSPQAEFMPQSVMEAVDAYTISALSVNPKISQLDALKLLRAPWLVRYIMDHISANSRTIESIAREVMEAKKNLKDSQTPDS